MDALLAIVQKLPLFRGCSPAQVREVLQSCQSRSFKKGDVLCRADEPSDALFIILTGTVAIHMADGLALLTQEAVTTIGEAGVLTGEPRSATVVAQTPLTALAISKRRLSPLMARDAALANALYRNVLFMVREKLIVSNRRIGQLLRERGEG